MTPQEAIKIIEVAKAECEWNAPLEYQGALAAAIEALEKQIPKTDVPDTNVGDLISRQDAIDAVKHAWAKGLEPSQYIEDLPSAQPEIIRCRECKYYDPNDHCFLQGAGPEDYCSCAERREE